MKTNSFISLWVMWAILLSSTGAVLAMNHGGGQQWGHDHSPADVIAEIPKQDLSDAEIDLLEKQYEEEMMANELYTMFFELYGVQTFKNIADSEAHHKEAIKALFDRYELDLPTSYDHIQELYDELKEKWEQSLKDALEVGVSIEIVDIEDIATAIKTSDNDDIDTIFLRIGGASYNHMRWFLKALSNNGLSTDIDYSDYLSEEDLNTKGPLVYMLAERLEAEGETLPEWSSSEEIKAMAAQMQGQQWGQMKGQWGQGYGKGEWYGMQNGSWSGKMMRNNDRANMNKYSNMSLLKARYKNAYMAKFGEVIAAMDDTKLETFIGKIDALVNKIQDGNYSSAIKEKYGAMLWALRDIAMDNLADDDSILDGLFE